MKTKANHPHPNSELYQVESRLRKHLCQLTFHAMLWLILITAGSARAQLRVDGYEVTTDVTGDFHAYYHERYDYGSGATITAYTNCSNGAYIFMTQNGVKITGWFTTNSTGWDTNAGALADPATYTSTKQDENGNYGTPETGNNTIYPPQFPNGYPAKNMTGFTESVDLVYLTDGDTNNLGNSAYEITVTATAYGTNGSYTVAPGDITVCGTTCDSDGKVTQVWPDCSTNSLTVSFAAAHTNATFNVNVSKIRPQIFLVRARYATGGDVTETISVGDVLYSTNVVTDATNSITVGEKVTLFCKIADGAGNIVTNPTISAWSWTIPGSTVSNYVANNNQGKVTEAYDKDKENCMFFWKDGTTNSIRVQCDATVSGATVSTYAWFDVVKPTIAFNVTVGANATFDANHLGIPGTKSIHWGTGEDGTSVGFSYAYDRSSQTNWGICQLLTSTRKYKDAGGVWHTRSGTSVLDNEFPNNRPSDSPARYVTGRAISADDKFDIWLMYNPQTPGSIWIPVWRCSQFGWSGSAEDPNADGTWPAASATVANDPGPFNVSITVNFPEWTQNWDQTTYVP